MVNLLTYTVLYYSQCDRCLKVRNVSRTFKHHYTCDSYMVALINSAMVIAQSEEKDHL